MYYLLIISSYGNYGQCVPVNTTNAMDDTVTLFLINYSAQQLLCYCLVANNRNFFFSVRAIMMIMLLFILHRGEIRNLITPFKVIRFLTRPPVPGETAPFTPVKRTEPAVLGLVPAPQVRDQSIYYGEIQTLKVKEADKSMICNTYWGEGGNHGLPHWAGQ